MSNEAVKEGRVRGLLEKPGVAPAVVVSLRDPGQLVSAQLARHFHLHHLAILQVAQSQATGQEQIQHRPARAEATGLAGEPASAPEPCSMSALDQRSRSPVAADSARVNCLNTPG